MAPTASARALGLAALLAAASGCDAQFKPETLVDGLRVLSIVADPPELAPGGTADLDALILDPSRPGQETTVLWIGCSPDPIDFNRSPCNDLTILLQPTKLQGFPEGVRLLGLGPTAAGGTHTTYSVPAALFDGVAADDPVRFNGTSGPVLAIVVAEHVDITTSLDSLHELFARMERQEVASALALVRVTVSEKSPRNQNPDIAQLLVDGQPWPVGARLQLHEGQTVSMNASAVDGAAETYTLLLPSGPEQRTEQLVGAWYSTGGRFTAPRVDLGAGDVTRYTAPGSAADDPVPDRRTGSMFFVLRDGRGGQANLTVPFYVCDSSPTPVVTAVELPATATDPVVVRGDNLTSVLDVLLGGKPLVGSAYSTVRKTFEGRLPALPPGTYPVEVHGKNCTSADTGLTVTIP